MADYFVPTDPKTGMLERRMLYLIHQMTFDEYFSSRAYTEVLTEHAERVGQAPTEIQFPLGLPDTQARLQALVDAIKQNGWEKEPIIDLCKRVIDPADPVWTATEKVDEAGIFVPYFHARDKAKVNDLVSEGFLDAANGWATYKVHALFSTAFKSYSGPSHGQRIKTITKAKKANVIRPSRMATAPDGTVIASTKGNKYCCIGLNCEYNGNEDFHCTENSAGGCDLMSDPCV